MPVAYTRTKSIVILKLLRRTVKARIQIARKNKLMLRFAVPQTMIQPAIKALISFNEPITKSLDKTQY